MEDMYDALEDMIFDEDKFETEQKMMQDQMEELKINTEWDMRCLDWKRSANEKIVMERSWMHGGGQKL